MGNKNRMHTSMEDVLSAGRRAKKYSITRSTSETDATLCAMPEQSSKGERMMMKVRRCTTALTTFLRVPLAAVALALPVAQSAPAVNTPPATTSNLWGQNGEKWNPQRRLPDFSRAGYHSGDDPLPDVPVVKNVVTDFGAKGDGTTDDSAAFERAIEGTDNGALSIPSGRYKITRPLFVRKSHLLLRGAGPDETILFCPRPLLEAQPAATLKTNWGFNYVKLPTNWKFRGGFLWFDGEEKGGKITDVTAGARRGDNTLQVADASRLGPGAWVRLLLFDDDKHTLGRHLHADQADLGPESYRRNGNNLVDWAARIVTVNGNQITLDRILRLDVRPEWKPELRAMQPTISECGVENLGFEFSGEKYPGHLQEHGYNALYWNKAVNCWAKNIWVTDGDIAFNMEERVRFCTVTDTRILANKRTAKQSAWEGTGHHGFQLAYLVQDCLIENFRFDTHYVHDLTVDSLPNGNVFSHGSGVYMNFDHHRGAPYENLFTDIDVGDPSRLWVSSGQPIVGPPSGVRETFWNIRTKANATPPQVPDWVQVNVIGLPGYTPYRTSTKQWIEPVANAGNLYQMQRARRLP